MYLRHAGAWKNINVHVQGNRENKSSPDQVYRRSVTLTVYCVMFVRAVLVNGARKLVLFCEEREARCKVWLWTKVVCNVAGEMYRCGVM